MSRKLLELARLHETTVTIEGETIRIREPNGLQMMEYRRLRSGTKGDPSNGIESTEPNLTDAIAVLIHGCCIDENGNQLYTRDESRVLAGAKSEIFLPLLLALMSFDIPSEKKTISQATNSSAVD